MTTPDGVELLIEWLYPLGEARSQRPAGAPLPMFVIRRIGGGDDGLTDQGVYSVHTLAGSEEEAQAEAMRAHYRILSLAPRFGGQQIVNGVYVDKVKTIEGPKPVDYINGVGRSVGTYRIELRFTDAG
ncbi:hypothetical protein ACP6C7_18885 [Mycolicibacterium septicum]|uniref:DUF3168 domain-containing protein n=1 Tax=Mycolicibacterium septicum TaxID=98668 RepID=A0ABW9LS04_9MYCO